VTARSPLRPPAQDPPARSVPWAVPAGLPCPGRQPGAAALGPGLSPRWPAGRRALRAV